MAKKIPMRMCVACRQMRPKKELTRVVRTPEGAVCVDPSGRANGRGAYLCNSAECLNRAMKIRALERALETPIDAETFARLQEAFADGSDAKA